MVIPGKLFYHINENSGFYTTGITPDLMSHQKVFWIDHMRTSLGLKLRKNDIISLYITCE